MITLGVDPGSITTGFALIESHVQHFKVLDYGDLRSSARLPLPNRIQKICQAMSLIVKRYQPELLAMESPFVHQNLRTALVLGHIRGALIATCYQESMDFKEFSPRSIKQAVTGSGSSSKERVQTILRYHLGLPQTPMSLDASDALAVAWTALQPVPKNSPRQRRSQARVHFSQSDLSQMSPAQLVVLAHSRRGKKR